MNPLINISEGASLAFHSLALIAREAPQRLNTGYIAKNLGASEAHLAKVFQRLSKAGVVSSVRGPSGGFILSKDPREISFLNIYEIMESKIDNQGCPLGRSECSFSSCIFTAKMSSVSQEIYNILETINLAEFSGSERVSRGTENK